MTEERIALLELIEKSGDAHLVRDLLAFAAERLMELEVEAKAGAAKGARSPSRAAQRNGYRERTWDTRLGQIDLATPKLRKGSYFPSFLEPRRTAERSAGSAPSSTSGSGPSSTGRSKASGRICGSTPPT